MRHSEQHDSERRGSWRERGTMTRATRGPRGPGISAMTAMGEPRGCVPSAGTDVGYIAARCAELSPPRRTIPLCQARANLSNGSVRARSVVRPTCGSSKSRCRTRNLENRAKAVRSGRAFRESACGSPGGGGSTARPREKGVQRRERR